MAHPSTTLARLCPLLLFLVAPAFAAGAAHVSRQDDPATVPAQQEPAREPPTHFFGTITGPDGEIVDDGVVSLDVARGMEPLETRIGADGSYRLSLRPQPSGQRQHAPYSLSISATGYVDTEVKLSEGHVIQHEYGDRLQLDVVLVRGQTVRVRALWPDGSPVAGAVVELRRELGREWPTMDKVPPDVSSVANETGSAVFSDMPSFGLWSATVSLPEYTDWHRVPIDIAQPDHDVEVPLPCTLRISLANECFTPVTPGRFRPRVEVLSGHGERGIFAPRGGGAVQGEVCTIDGFRIGDVARLNLYLAKGVYRELEARLRITATLQDVAYGCGNAELVRLPMTTTEGLEEIRVNWRLVDREGLPMIWADLGAYVPDHLRCRWATDGGGDEAAARFGQFSPESPAAGSFDVFASLPLTVTIRGYGIDQVALVAKRSTVVEIPFDVASLLGPRSAVHIRGLEPDGDTADVGWALELHHVETWRRFLANAQPSEGTGIIDALLPAGRYVYTGFAGDSGLAAGSFVVDGESPIELDVTFPGHGAVRGQIIAGLPVYSVRLAREDGFGQLNAGLHAARVGADGRFSVRNVLAGEYSVMAMFLTPEGSVAATIARGLHVAPRVITEFDRIEIGDTLPEGVLLRRRTDEPGVVVQIRQDGRLLYGGWLAPGDGVLLPGTSAAHVRVIQDRLGWIGGPEVVVPIEGAGPLVEF